MRKLCPNSKARQKEWIVQDHIYNFKKLNPPDLRHLTQVSSQRLDQEIYDETSNELTLLGNLNIS